MDELRLVHVCLSEQPDVVCITETWLDEIYWIQKFQLKTTQLLSKAEPTCW